MILNLELDGVLGSKEIADYLEHVRAKYHPRMTPDAASALKNYFWKLKTSYGPNDTIFPVSIRVFESLLRICQARARLACRNEVLLSDVEEIKDLYSQMMLQSLFCEEEMQRNNRLRVDLTNVSNLSLPKQTKAFIEVLNSEAEMKPDRNFTMTELRQIAKGMNMRVGEFHDYIERLNHEGYLLKKGGNLYHLLASDRI